MRALLILALLLLPTLASGGDAVRISPEQFEKMSTGHTLYFTQGGALFGAEEYHPGRKVIWRFSDSECLRGRWWSEPGDVICFEYEGQALVQCWGFYKDDEGYFARSLDSSDPTGDLRLSGISDQPLPCEGPDAGV